MVAEQVPLTNNNTLESMRSPALDRWKVERRRRLVDLRRLHRHAPMSEERICWSRVVLLAAEFQGYCRDLHDTAGINFARLAAPENGELRSILRARAAANRQLDRGNAHPGNLASDFLILGLPIWEALEACDAARTKSWKNTLESLNRARNAIAHSNVGEILKLDIRPQALDRWYAALDILTEKMDHVVAEHLCYVFDTTDPWSGYD